MGNLFSSKITCKECKERNLKPEYIHRTIIEGNKELFKKIPKMYDERGRELPIMLQHIRDKEKYSCSNGHVWTKTIY